MAKILLVDDDDSMRLFIGGALERAGYDVTMADRGAVALPLIVPGGYDLLLTDIMMPEMDGIELAQRAVALCPSIRVMFITGFAAVALNRMGGVPPVDATVLSKPFHLRDLVVQVDRIFQENAA